MNVDNPSNRNKSSCEVKSKYFATKSGMDESLSDFQEKKNFSEARKTQPSTSKSKPKKRTKKIRGQKDIRTALKGNKNELIAYSTEFDKLCKQSGIDVDPEQLQLAIALSKSLQESDKQEDTTETPQPLSSQERVRKLRKNLLEYGFKVPEIKITKNNSKKVKRFRKDYKLLTASQEEKQQIISDKYTQVLFNNFESKKVTKSCNFARNCSSLLYHTATNISYEEIKDDIIFYSENVVEKLPSSLGTLLKDWSEIPGRPISPVPQVFNLEFHKVDCSQEELDTVLSGLLKSAQEIVRNKYSLLTPEDSSQKESGAEILKMDVECIEINAEEPDRIESVIDVENVTCKTIDLTKADNGTTATQNLRSCSPDLFDDDISSIVDNSSSNIETISQEIPVERSARVCCKSFDLTDDYVTSKFNRKDKLETQCSQASQGSNVTKRKSNDFMEMTECVVGSSQPIRENKIEEANIDLTQHSDDETDVTVIIDKSPEVKSVLSTDLTQTSESSELPDIQIPGNDSLDDNTIIINEELYSDVNNKNHPCSKQTSDIDTDCISRKVASLSPIYASQENNAIHDRHSITINSDDEDYKDLHESNKPIRARSISPFETIDGVHDLDKTDILHNAKTQDFGENQDLSKIFTNDRKSSDVADSKSKTESFFEEFIHHHSESSKENNDVHSLDLNSNGSLVNADNDNIDLTQSTDSPKEDCFVIKENIPKISSNVTHLGKIGNVSIDYDEMFDDIMRSHGTSGSQMSKSNITDSNIDSAKPSTSDNISKLSQDSEVFEISDQELNYSMHKSRLDMEEQRDNFYCGGISVVDNLPDLPSFRPSKSPNPTRNLKKSLSDSFLPPVDIMNKLKTVQTSPTKSLPMSLKGKKILAETPKNGEYVLKTDDVTPMLDYEAMSTPEVNAELDKYGLKPFKRKRAIQLLTHLYNQTHPIVSSCSEEDNLCSPSKRRKPNASPVKIISPKKISEKFKQSEKSPKKKVRKKEVMLEKFDEENSNIYEVTDEKPDIRDIYCAEEDWVFPKREKAKTATCGVPLHISLHNYLASRRRLRDAVLRYEPVSIDAIHRGLAANGARYDAKDLLKFMDKKCITVKTADGTRNKKHY